MKKTAQKLFSAIALLMAALFLASCKEKSIGGRVYAGVYDDFIATVSFEKNGSAHFELKGTSLSASLEYEADKGTFSGYNINHPAIEFEGKYDDDALLLIWWDGHPVILYRADGGKKPESSKNAVRRKNSVEGRTFQVFYDDVFTTIAFDKFGLVHLSFDDETQYAFYTEDKKAKNVAIREEYDDTDEYDEDTLIFHYDDDALWGTFNDEEIRLEDLDKKLAANHAARGSDW